MARDYYRIETAAGRCYWVFRRLPMVPGSCMECLIKKPRVVTVLPHGTSTTDCSYAELHAKSNFSFLEGASHPEELVEHAAELHYAALAVTDRNSLAGIVRAHVAAKEHGLKLVIGARSHQKTPRAWFFGPAIVPPTAAWPGSSPAAAAGPKKAHAA